MSALAFNGNSTLLASAQAGPPSVVRLWDFPMGSCLSVFKTHVRSLLSLRWVSAWAQGCVQVGQTLQHGGFSVLFLHDKPGVNYSSPSAACVYHRDLLAAGPEQLIRCQLPPELVLQVLLSPHTLNLSPFIPHWDALGVQGAAFHQVASSCSFSYSGAVLCGVGKDGHGKTVRTETWVWRFPPLRTSDMRWLFSQVMQLFRRQTSALGFPRHVLHCSQREISFSLAA